MTKAANAEKSSFQETAPGAVGRQIPRCSAEIAAKYRSKERTLPTGEPSKLHPHDRRAQYLALVDHHLGKESKAPVEPYLRDAVYRWLLSSARTVPSARTYVGRFAWWCRSSDKRSLSLQTNARPADVQDYLYGLEERGCAPRTIVGGRDVLRSWFAWLEDRDLVQRSPITRDIRRAWRIDHQQMVRGTGRRQALSQVEAQRLADWCFSAEASPEEGFATMLELVSALRSEEIANAQMAGLTLREDGTGTLVVPGKGRKSRTVRLEQAVVAAFRRYMAARRRQGTRGPLISKPGGGTYTARTVQSWLKRALGAIGRDDLSSHDLRRTSVTLLVKRGAHLKQAQDLAGHASVNTTLRCYVADDAEISTTTGITAPEQPPQGKQHESDSRP